VRANSLSVRLANRCPIDAKPLIPLTSRRNETGDEPIHAPKAWANLSKTPARLRPAPSRKILPDRYPVMSLRANLARSPKRLSAAGGRAWHRTGGRAPCTFDRWSSILLAGVLALCRHMRVGSHLSYHPGMPDQPEPTAAGSSNVTDRDAPRWLLPALAIASLRDDVPERRMLSCLARLLVRRT
jgi:hypothetical protein